MINKNCENGCNKNSIKSVACLFMHFTQISSSMLMSMIYDPAGRS